MPIHKAIVVQIKPKTKTKPTRLQASAQGIAQKIAWGYETLDRAKRPGESREACIARNFAAVCKWPGVWVQGLLPGNTDVFVRVAEERGQWCSERLSAPYFVVEG